MTAVKVVNPLRAHRQTDTPGPHGNARSIVTGFGEESSRTKTGPQSTVSSETLIWRSRAGSRESRTGNPNLAHYDCWWALRGSSVLARSNATGCREPKTGTFPATKSYNMKPSVWTKPYAGMWLLPLLLLLTLVAARAYDPTDPEIANIIPPKGTFEAFYPREMYGVKNGNSRPAHAHGSFYSHRNPALIEVRNAAAYGFRFDGKRRFNFD
uniref:Uncharacterized protein n=2 Tax=Anopheles atroparvus TaxID=41427 RepID=A0A182JF59_ANOAO